MKAPYLEVTFRHGRPLAGYLYLPAGRERRSVRSERIEPAMVIDFDAQDQPLGIEITAPERLTLLDLNRVLARLGLTLVTSADLAPLKAA